MFIGTYSTMYKGEEALQKKYPSKRIFTQLASSKTLNGAKKAAARHGFPKAHIFKASDRDKYYVYI